MLIKVWTAYWERVVRAAGAELTGSGNDRYDVVGTVLQAADYLKISGSRFFKVISDQGAYVGYFIQSGDTVPMSFVRPHMREQYQSEFSKLISETIDTGLNFSLQRSNFNIKS